MAMHGDPKVRAWMKEHAEETKKVERLYNALKVKSMGDLYTIAGFVGLDPKKLEAQFKNSLITAIVKQNADRALEIAEGQGIMEWEHQFGQRGEHPDGAVNG